MEPTMRKSSATVLLAAPDADLGIVPASKAKRRAKQVANETGEPITVREPTTDKVVAVVKPKRKARAKAKHAKPNGHSKAIAHRGAAPEGKAAEVLKLASRPNGATRAELIALTGWKQQAWKWGFENSKGTGWCQRHGYRLNVIERKSGETAYHVTKK